MDPRERFESITNTLIAAQQGWQSELWTALPAFVVSYNMDAGTIVAQPTVSLKYVNALNQTLTINLPPLPDVPVCFPHGGGFSLTFPIQLGDECLIIFASRCIDGWWAYSGIQQQVEPRMHDLSDGFAIMGPRSKPKAISQSGLSDSAVQLRKDDGSSYIQIDTSGDITIVAPLMNVNITGAANITSEAGIVLTAPPNTIIANGNVLG